MEKHSFKLKNNLKVIFIPYREVNSITVSFMGLAGSVQEKTNETGGAHFLEHLVFDGTEKYPNSKQIDGLLEKIGGRSNAGTGKEHVEYWAKTLKEHAETNFEYLSQLVLHPLLKEKEVRKEKKVIEQEINRFKDSPEAFTPRIAYKDLYPNQRLGHFISGDVKEIKALKQSDIHSYYSRNYVSENFVLAVCGNTTLSEIQNLAAKYFETMPKGARQAPGRVEENTKRAVQILNKKDLNQASLQISYFGYPINSEKRYAANVLAYALGVGFSSRLFQTIRDKHGLVYTVSAYQTSGSNFGVFAINAGLAEDKINKTIKLVNKELGDLVENHISEEELQTAINSITSGFTFGFENPAARASYYAHMSLFKPHIDSHEEEIEKYKKVTSAHVKSVAQEIFNQPAKITIVSPNFLKAQLLQYPMV